MHGRNRCQAEGKEARKYAIYAKAKWQIGLNSGKECREVFAQVYHFSKTSFSKRFLRCEIKIKTKVTDGGVVGRKQIRMRQQVPTQKINDR